MQEVMKGRACGLLRCWLGRRGEGRLHDCLTVRAAAIVRGERRGEVA